MAQKRYRQGPWPPRTDDQPDGWFQHPDCVLKYDRSLAGPLRYGTEPRVGPTGGAIEADYTRDSDFGMDRIAKDFDPMGTPRNRFGTIGSDLVARQVRRGLRPGRR